MIQGAVALAAAGVRGGGIKTFDSPWCYQAKASCNRTGLLLAHGESKQGSM